MSDVCFQLSRVISSFKRQFLRTFYSNFRFPGTTTHHKIHQDSHGDDKGGVQKSEQVSLGGEDGEEVAAKGEAGEVGDDNWYDAAWPDIWYIIYD